MAAINRLEDPPTWLAVAVNQEIDLQPWAPRQWTFTATRWWCGPILLPSLTLRSAHPQGELNTWVQGDVRLFNKRLCIFCCIREVHTSTQWRLVATYKSIIVMKCDPRLKAMSFRLTDISESSYYRNIQQHWPGFLFPFFSNDDVSSANLGKCRSRYH